MRHPLAQWVKGLTLVFRPGCYLRVVIEPCIDLARAHLVFFLSLSLSLCPNTPLQHGAWAYMLSYSLSKKNKKKKWRSGYSIEGNLGCFLKEKKSNNLVRGMTLYPHLFYVKEEASVIRVYSVSRLEMNCKLAHFHKNSIVFY